MGTSQVGICSYTLEEELFAKDMNQKEGDLKEFAAVLKFDELEEIIEEDLCEKAEVSNGP